MTPASFNSTGSRLTLVWRDTGELKEKGKEKQKDDADAETDKAAKQEEEEVNAEGDPTASLQNLQPNIPKDYELFLNLVEFCKKVLLLESVKTKEGSNDSTAATKSEPDVDHLQAAEVKVEDEQKEGSHFICVSAQEQTLCRCFSTHICVCVQTSGRRKRSSLDGCTCSAGSLLLGVTNIHSCLVLNSLTVESF